MANPPTDPPPQNYLLNPVLERLETFGGCRRPFKGDCKETPKGTKAILGPGMETTLAKARMEGVWRSTSEVTVFLDSHIEAGSR